MMITAASLLLSVVNQSAVPETGAPHEVTDKPATVIFYRTGGFRGALVGCSVREKGREIAHLSPNSTVSLPASPGRHTYSSRDGASNLTIELAAAETSYVRCRMTGLVAHPILELSDDATFGQVSPRLTDKTSTVAEPH
jgi:hypothetical protein